MWKSLQFVPVVAKPKAAGKLAAAVPVLVSVTICVLLVLPTATLPKLSDAGDSVKLMLPRPVERQLMGAAWGVVTNGHRARPCPCQGGSEPYAQRARSARQQCTAAVVALVKVAGTNDTAELQRSTARILQRY